jgi:AraC-like DNA-binding protein
LFTNDFSITFNGEHQPFFYRIDYKKACYSMLYQHFHPYYEIFISQENGIFHTLEGEYFPLEPNDVVCIKPLMLHRSEYPHNEAKRRIIITFDYPEEYYRYNKNFRHLFDIFYQERKVFRFPFELQKTIFAPLNEIFLLSRQKPDFMELVINNKLQEFLWHLSCNKEKNIYEPSTYIPTSRAKISDITSFINNHFDEDLSLPYVADTFAISESYLCRQFKKYTGLTFTAYLQKIRIQMAQQKLLFGKEKIMDIAGQCGFSSFSQFNRSFRKVCSMTPSRFRQNEDNKSYEIIASYDPESYPITSLKNKD